MICDNITVKDGVLHFAGQSTVQLAQQYGTPLYLLDEDYIRRQCRVYKAAFARHFGPTSRPLFASKACCFTRIYEIMREEGMGIDVVSPCEIYTARRAGFDLRGAYFHGNNKTDADIAFAMECGVGCFVADGREELDAIEREAARRGLRQKVLLRLTPGIDPHTYEAVATGKVDSKFGAAIETGQAEQLALHALELPHVELMGFHCHVGSQVFGEDIFERAASIMLAFIAHMERTHGYRAAQLDLGGGYGVRYVDTDPHLDVETKVAQVAQAVRAGCDALGIAMPEIHMEPGRSIVGAAGMTLYTVGSVKRIPGYKNYVSVDGGMADNPRFALYRSQYTCPRTGWRKRASWRCRSSDAAAKAATSSRSTSPSPQPSGAATSSRCAPRARITIPWRQITTACPARRSSCCAAVRAISPRVLRGSLRQ